MDAQRICEGLKDLQAEVQNANVLEHTVTIIGVEQDPDSINKALGELEDLVAGYAVGARQALTGDHENRLAALKKQVGALVLGY